MNNIYKVNYRGKEYVGAISSITSLCREYMGACGEMVFNQSRYSITLIDKDTGVYISGITIDKISDLKEVSE